MGSNEEYDVFISYSRVDAAWANTLAADLDAKQVRVFLDNERLQGGERWMPQLLAGLKASRHLLVLWSKEAKASNWVQQELNRFRQIVDPDGLGLLSGRRIFLVLMDDAQDPASDVQTYRDIRRGNLYPGTPEAAGETWARLVEKIAEAVHGDDGSMPIPLLVVTTTRDRIDALDVNRAPPAGPVLAELIGELGIASKEALRELYGASRLDWRPFGSNESVRTILEQLKDQLNADITAEVLPGRTPSRFRWDYVDDDFWSDVDAADRVTKKLRSGLAVVVVDPLSFYDDVVFARYANQVSDILMNAHAFTLVLAPFTLPASARALREALRAMARRVFAHFYEPPAFSGQAYARSSASVGDAVEFRGWVTTALASHLASSRSGSNPYLDASS
jgi:hypothetical protein